VTSVIILLEYVRQSILTLLYRELIDDSNITLITLYEAENKPEKAKEWQAKLLQIEAVRE